MRGIGRDIFVVILGTCSYGLALGLWRSPQMAFYVSVKLPVVFVGTTVLVSVFSWMSALLAGTEMRYRDVFEYMFSAISVAARILLALTPVVLFLILSGAPTVGSRAELRFAHSCLMLTHLAVLAGAGVVGNLRLYADLKTSRKDQSVPLVLLGCWLAAFAVAGCQVGWMMRPLVGSPNIKVEFLRADALQGNVIESLSSQVIPHFINRGTLKNKGAVK